MAARKRAYRQGVDALLPDKLKKATVDLIKRAKEM
jgi:hypothetical protein